MAFNMKGFGKPKVTDDSNNMTKGAAIKMNASPVMKYSSPVKQVADKGVKGRSKDYTYSESGEVIGIEGSMGESWRPTKKGAEMIKKGEGELFKPGALDDYKGSIVEGEGGIIRGFKTAEGKYTGFVNPTTRERLTKEQQKQLKDFERTRDIYNRQQARKRETIRKVKGYSGPYAQPDTPVQKKYKK